MKIIWTENIPVQSKRSMILHCLEKYIQVKSSYMKVHLLPSLYQINNQSQKNSLLTISKVNWVKVNCTFMLHLSMWSAALFVIDITMSFFKKTYLWMHRFGDFISVSQQSLSKWFKEFHVMMQYHMHFQGQAQIKLCLQLLKDIAYAPSDWKWAVYLHCRKMFQETN